MTAMLGNGNVGAWLMFAVEPSDRALAGWCPLPPHLVTDSACRSFVRQSVYGASPLYGPSVTANGTYID